MSGGKFTFVISDIDTSVTVAPLNQLPVRINGKTCTAYRLIGSSTKDTFYNKTIIDPSNHVAANALLLGSTLVNLTAGGNPGDVLTLGAGNLATFAPPATPSGGTFIDNQITIVDATDNTKVLAFDVQGSPGTTTTLITSQTANRNFITPDISGTALVAETGTNMVYIGGPTTPLHGSNSGVQYSSTFASRAQYRCNQYGVNTGVPGISTFKSRGATIGSLAPVLVGDVIFRDTAVGVTGNNSIPLSGLISINVTAVPPAVGWIGTEFELQLVPNVGPANSRRPVFKVNGYGWPQLLEPTSTNPQAAPKTPPSGLVTLGAGATITVPNIHLPANTRVLLTVQPGPAPLGTVWCSAITPGDDVAVGGFTISSTNVGDVGVNVYYQVWVPLP
jgi:hypothetical protein